MKQPTVIFLVLALLASLVACGNAKDAGSQTDDTTTPVVTTAEKPADVTTDSEGDVTPPITTEEPGTDDPVPTDSVAGEYALDMFFFTGTLKFEEGGKVSMISSFGSAEDGALELITTGTYTAEGNKASCVFTESAQRLVFADSGAKDEFLAEVKNQLDSGSITEEEYNQALELLSEEGVKSESEDMQFDDLDVYVLDKVSKVAYQCESRNGEYVEKTEYDDNFNIIGRRYESSDGISESKYDSEGNEIYSLYDDEDGNRETYQEYQDGKVVKEKRLEDGELVSERYLEYDDHGNETKITEVEDGETYVTEFKNEYDASGNLIKMTTIQDGESYDQFYEYYDDGDPKSAKTVYADGSYSYTEWDEDFNTTLFEYTDGDDVHTTVYTYDEDGFCIYEKETVNGAVVYEGDPYERDYDWDD